MIKTISLQNKIFSIFSIVILLSIGFIGIYGFKTTSDSYIERAYELSEYGTRTLDIAIEENLGHVTKDSLYAKEFYALERYMIWKSMSVEKKAQRWKHVFSDAF